MMTPLKMLQLISGISCLVYRLVWGQSPTEVKTAVQEWPQLVWPSKTADRLQADSRHRSEGVATSGVALKEQCEP